MPQIAIEQGDIGVSMPVLTYGCTSCDLNVWDAQTWRYRYYLIDGQRYRMRTVMGWCHPCGSLVAVEKRPDLATEQLLLAELHYLEEQLTGMQPRRDAKRRWWLGGIIKTSQQRSAEAAVESAKDELKQLCQLRGLMAERREANRCMSCGSQACFHLPASPVKSSFDFYNEHPQPLGLKHPGCGGQLTVCGDGLRLSVKAASRAYDLRGNAIGPWVDF